MTIYVEIRCDAKPAFSRRCGEAIDDGSGTGDAERALERAVRDYGWQVVGDKHYCEDHAAPHTPGPPTAGRVSATGETDMKQADGQTDARQGGQ